MSLSEPHLTAGTGLSLLSRWDLAIIEARPLEWQMPLKSMQRQGCKLI